jgi:ABC-type branched-subunit amino acid transport system substrate-binding protein
MGRAFAEARRIGIKAPFYSIASVTSPGFVQFAGHALEGTYVSNWLIPRNPLHAEYAAQFKALHGSDIVLDFVVGPTRDAVVLVSNALKTSREAAEIRKALSSQPAFTGISGQIDMDSDGAVRSIQEKLFVYRSGKLVPEEG